MEVAISAKLPETFSPTVPPCAARISRVVADVQAPCGESGNVWRRGKAMANYPQALAQDAVCQSHTGHRTGLWFLPTRHLRLNTNEWMNQLILTRNNKSIAWNTGYKTRTNRKERQDLFRWCQHTDIKHKTEACDTHSISAPNGSSLFLEPNTVITVVLKNRALQLCWKRNPGLTAWL